MRRSEPIVVHSNKILYDFADIEKYSPDADTNFQEYYADDACDYNHPSGGYGSIGPLTG